MKRLFIISALVAFASFSCQKEVIKPIQQRDSDAGYAKIMLATPIPTKTTFDPTSSSTGKGITDPNNDPDMTKKGH